MDKANEQNQSNILVRLAVNRIDQNLPSNQDPQLIFYTPGEEISTQPDFLRYCELKRKYCNFLDYKNN